MKFLYFVTQLCLVLALVQLVMSGDKVVENVNENKVQNLGGTPYKDKLNLIRMDHNDDGILHL